MPSLSRNSKRKIRVTPSLRSEPSLRIIGDGEMAELTRSFDWGKTQLGRVETWSDTLLTTVNLILASRHPMFLWWGPELIQFYNDGYRPSIRADKHPIALGQRGVECWPEIWPIIGPQIKAVMEQGDSTWNTNQLVPINRNGKLEEVYWTYSYSPVRDKDGTVRGTLVACSETTEQVLSERRLRTLLSITLGSPIQTPVPEPEPLLSFVQAIVKKLDEAPADFPFAALHILTQSEFLHAGSTASTGALSHPDHWPLASTANAGTPLLATDLQQRFGDIICQPWPEPVTSAYLLPLQLSGSSIRAVLVFGISPRLPFDNSYETFFQLVGARIAGLLQSEVHKMELAQAAKRFSSLAEANPFGMVMGSLRGELDYANPAFLKTMGYSAAEVNAGKVRWDDLTPPEYAQADAHAIHQLLESGRCDVYEKAYIAKDGRHIPILIGASIIESSARDLEFAAFVTDLTPLKIAQEALRKANDELEKKVAERTVALETEVSDRKRAEISLRELTGRLLLAQDEERRYMARELHDHAGQTLVALALNLFTLQAAAKGKDAKIVGLAAEGQKLSDDLSKEIRTLSYLLHPPLLDEVGLASALRWYVDGFSERSKIKVDLDLPADLGRLPNELELVIFRVVQESLTNIHRHSGSLSARIYLTRSESTVELEISDRGKGISPERQREMTAAKVGVGVRGMKERIRQFRGTLQIVSNGQGTRVVAMIPLVPDTLEA
jgi:PAS domain S-box-containing protein